VPDPVPDPRPAADQARAWAERTESQFREPADGPILTVAQLHDALRHPLLAAFRDGFAAGYAAALERAAGELESYASTAGDTFNPKAVMRKMAAHLRELTGSWHEKQDDEPNC
jgi:hypothetical protein